MLNDDWGNANDDVDVLNDEFGAPAMRGVDDVLPSPSIIGRLGYDQKDALNEQFWGEDFWG